MTGFFGGGKDGEIMLLGRGGSDFSASISGISLNANVVEIWTDVDGVMSADPKLVKNAKTWSHMNKDVASEMARAGAKVLHPKTVLASYYNIDILIKNLFHTDFKGTIVDSNSYGDGVYGVVSDGDYSILYFENYRMFGNPGFIAEIGNIAEDNNISIDMIATSETSVSFTVKTKLLTPEAIKLFNSIADFRITHDVSKISIIGENIANDTTLEKIFTSLKKVKINSLMVSMDSQKTISG